MTPDDGDPAIAFARLGPVAASGDTRRTALLVVGESTGTQQLFDDVVPPWFEITRVPSMAAAALHLLPLSIDCALIDLRLPDAEIFEIVRGLSTHHPSLAVVVLTGRADDGLGEAMVGAGASDYLPRPTSDHASLVRSIRHAIVRKRAEMSLAEAQAIARVGSWEVDIATSTVSWSRELYRLFEFSEDVRPSYEALLDRTHPEDRASCLRVMRLAMDEFRPFLVEHRVVLPDDSIRWVRTGGRVEVDGAGRIGRLLGTAQDITEQKATQEAALQQALHDPLTGLPNRLLLIDRLNQALNRLVRLPSTMALICLDIDRFKVINESLGLAVGDQVLLSVVERLGKLMRPEDTLARTGGDEFVVLCEGLDSETDALQFADRLCASMASPLAWDGGDVMLSISAGVAVTSSGAVGPDSLLRDANIAMYRSKGACGGRASAFAESMRTDAIGRLDTERALRRALVDDELTLHYQPIVSLADERVVGHEALVRWNHPTRGLLGPDEFIGIAEDTGLIVPIGSWVLREACLQAKRFQACEPRWAELTMSVNLSGGQLNQPDLLSLVETAMRDADLRPQDLRLEMTESVLMDDATSTVEILEGLKALGVKLAIDDFGTAYSSLAYLRRFPVDVLKIDRSFVSKLGDNLEDSAIAAAIVSLADTLGLTTTAEGVETVLQRDSLIGLGCTRAQGYLFGRPVSAADSEAALRLAPVHSPGLARAPSSSHLALVASLSIS